MNEEIKGLTTEEVRTRIKSNKTNIVTVDTEDSIKDIIYKNRMAISLRKGFLHPVFIFKSKIIKSSEISP